ncbi:predicted protein [Nematostella vectensis]|uniref:Protein kinase domain-containing protein n=1 Tax=Nematostella vectensis TaxID=45351 RepID=A7ST70_NEMVE|nr:predicted protein [Nematostella vectensis]|eukprot:XP_001625199.1 predicted protein [Nematostella vectensis]
MTRLFVRGSSWEDPPTEKEVEEHFTGFHSFSREQDLIWGMGGGDLPAKDTSIGNSIMMRTSRLFSPNARGEIPGAFRIGGCRSGHWMTLDTDEFDTLMYRDEEEGTDLCVEATFVLLCKGPTQKDLRAGTDPEVDPVQVVMSKTSIGSGASSRVFKGTYPLPSGTLTHVACKEFIVPISLKHKVRLKRELQFLKQIKHPNILHHCGYDFTRSILVTELLEKEIVIANEKIQIHNARDLLDVAEEICLPWKDRAFVIKEAAKGLSYLHNKGIVHSDIKTCNILVGESSSEAYKVKLGDFGAAHYEFRQFSTSTTSCSMEAQTVIGTAAYTAPELLERGAMPDMASDVYSFAMVLIEFAMPSRSSPWQGDASNSSILYDFVRRGERPSFNVSNIELDSNLRNTYLGLVEQAWSQDPRKRPSSTDIFETLSNFHSQIGPKKTSNADDGITCIVPLQSHQSLAQEIVDELVSSSPDLETHSLLN